MKESKIKYHVNFKNLLNAVLNCDVLGGHKSVTLKRVKESDPYTIQRLLKPILSLDYEHISSQGRLQTFMDILDSRSIVESTISTITDEIHERDVEDLVQRTRKKIQQKWHLVNHARGMNNAIGVFDGLCQEYTDSEISRKLDISREAVRQIKGQLVKFPDVKEMRHELRLMCRDS